MVYPKSVGFLSSAEVWHINHCIVKGFIYSFPDNSLNTNVSTSYMSSKFCQQQPQSRTVVNTSQHSNADYQNPSHVCDDGIVSNSHACDTIHNIGQTVSCQSSPDNIESLDIEIINILTVVVIHLIGFLCIICHSDSDTCCACRRICNFVDDFVYLKRSSVFHLHYNIMLDINLSFESSYSCLSSLTLYRALL